MTISANDDATPNIGALRRTPMTHVRVEFIIREVNPDGTPLAAEEEPRGLRLGETVHVAHLADLFERSSRAAGMLFVPQGRLALCLVRLGPNKIQVIKVLRELTGVGLKEAKDMSEAPVGTPLFAGGTRDDMMEAVRRLSAAHATVEVRSVVGINVSLPQVLPQ